MFDHLIELTQHLTGKRPGFKCLSRDGTLDSMGTDMELALIQAAGASFLKTNEPEYSGVVSNDPEDIVAHFLRICLTHCKR